jgi:flagellar biogenesis protein FliO
MLLPITLLPLAAVLINDVKADTAGNVLTVDVATSEPVAREDVRAASGGSHRYYVYVDESSTPQAQFANGGQPIVVHPRTRYTKLEITTPSRCAEPFAIEPVTGGVRLRAACREVAGAQSLGAPPVRVGGKSVADRPLPDAPLAAQVEERTADSSLRAALVLPADNGPGGVASGGGKAGETAKAPVAGTDEVAAQGQQAHAQPALAATKSMAPEAGTPADGTASASGSAGGAGSRSDSNLASTAIAAVLLIGLGIAAFTLAKRRGGRGRMIRILETASIGPRRSLVVASIQGRTMVLGVSEAGVSLLDAPAGVGSEVVDHSDKPSTGALEEAALGLRQLVFGKPQAAEAPIEQGRSQGSLLGRLFGRNRPVATDGSGLPVDDTGRAFDELLSESLEDQELRRKLSLGQTGRVA